MKDYSIPFSVLQKLPTGKPLRVEKVTHMDGSPRTAVLWIWTDYREPHPRKAHFDIKTGEYLGEAW